MKHRIAFVVIGLVCAVRGISAATVESKIWKNLEETETTNVKVTFKKANSRSCFERFNSLNLTSRNDKLNNQYAILKEDADIVQADVISTLKNAARYGNDKKHKIAQLWISNELIVRNVDKETVKMLRDHPDVESLEAEWFIKLEDVIEEATIAPYNETFVNQWGVVNVGSPDVWNKGNTGEGVVVGVIDTGVRATHATLRSTYRGNNPGQNHNYNWFDPGEQAAVPSDENGHGTHVIGSASGTKGIGVAPGSRWIICRACDGFGSCSKFDLSECGNWMACPTNTSGGAADCTRAPNVVNNSWGSRGSSSWYDSIIAAWRNVNTVPIFSAGNFGPGCSSLGSPGDRPLAIGIGSIADGNRRSSFSSNGPTKDGRINPLIAAPGSNVRSASYSDDLSLRTLSGTSMAAPHATGVVALLLARNRNLTVPQVIAALQAGAIPHAPVGAACGGIADDVFPNNHVGYGRIWAPAAVNSVKLGL